MPNHSRLKTTELKSHRVLKLVEQRSRCGLCSQPVSATEAVYDHDHKTGRCRAVLHRGCNAMLGHIENNMPRHKLTSMARLSAMLRSVPEYISRDWSDQPLHPTHRSADEKRLLRNKRAKLARAKKKREGKA